jgi:hypothetical protein
VQRLETVGLSADTDLMRPPRPISLQGTLLLNWVCPGAGQRRLGQREKGRRMLALHLVLAIPAAVLWLSSESLVAVVAMLPAASASWWSQVDLRRSLGLPLWPLFASRSQTFDALRGRDTFYPNDPLQSAPEKPSE